MLPGMTGIAGAAGYVEEVAAEPVASFVFSGSGFGSGQVLSRTNSTSSPETRRMTFSFWANIDSYKSFDGDGAFFLGWAYDSGNDDYDYMTLSDVADGNMFVYGYSVLNTAYGYTGGNHASGWRHFVIRYDIQNASSTARVRGYINGTLVTSVINAVSTTHELLHLKNGQTFNIGSEAYTDGRIAFPELVVGQSLAPTEFAFNDGGTWTAKKYTGSYGTYGFRLDGTGGANGCNDVSGNGMNFTPTNWNVSNNLDYSELPPRNF